MYSLLSMRVWNVRACKKKHMKLLKYVKKIHKQNPIVKYTNCPVMWVLDGSEKVVKTFLWKSIVFVNICIKKATVQIKNNSLAMEDLLFFVRILPVIIESSTIFWWNAWHNWCHYFCWQHHHATQYQLQLEDCWPLVVKLKIRAKWKNNFFFSGIVDNFFASFELKGKRKCYIQQLFSVFFSWYFMETFHFHPRFSITEHKTAYNWIANSALHTCL